MKVKIFTIIEIETHNRCTRHCWFCKHGQKSRNSSRLLLPDEVIERIAENLHDLNYAGRISPFGINEPLMDPRIFDIIRLFRRKCPQAFISIGSNGDLLTEKNLQQLLDAGLDALGLSIYDEAAWQRLAPFHRHPNVRFNDMRIPDRWVENRGGSLGQVQSWPALDLQRPCLRPFKMMVIRADGSVVLCCGDMYIDAVLGNVAQQRLEDIWNSEAFDYFRTRLASAGRIGLQLCQECSHDGSSCSDDFPYDLERTRIPAVREFLKQWLPPEAVISIKKNLPRRWLPRRVDDVIKRNLLKHAIRKQLEY
jgi:radical SAM protein with 4Fe4S-binding SPASM domain